MARPEQRSISDFNVIVQEVAIRASMEIYHRFSRWRIVVENYLDIIDLHYEARLLMVCREDV
jgi:hypothetical protein